MSDEDNVWVSLLTGGIGLFTVALLLLDQTAWYVQYGVFGLSMVLLVSAMLRSRSKSATS